MANKEASIDIFRKHLIDYVDDGKNISISIPAPKHIDKDINKDYVHKTLIIESFDINTHKTVKRIVLMNDGQIKTVNSLRELQTFNIKSEFKVTER